MSWILIFVPSKVCKQAEVLTLYKRAVESAEPVINLSPVKLNYKS